MARLCPAKYLNLPVIDLEMRHGFEENRVQRLRKWMPFFSPIVLVVQYLMRLHIIY
jgi:hypothetical protein